MIKTKSTETKAETEYWKKLVVVLCFGWVAIWIYRTVLTPIYPEIQSALGGLSDTEIGFIATFYYGAYCSGQIPASMAVEKVGQKITLLCGFTLFTIGTLIIANATDIAMVYGGSVFSGLGCASFFCSAYSLSGENVPEERRAFASAIVNSGSAIGMGVGLIGSSILVKNLHLPWNDVLYISAAVIVVMIVVFATMIKPREKKVVRKSKLPGASPASAEKSATTDDEETPKSGKKGSLFTPELLTIYFLYFCTCYGYYMIVTWLPSYLQTERGFEGAAIGGASAMVAVVAVPGALFFSVVADKFRQQNVQLVIVLQIASALMLSMTVFAGSTTVVMTSLLVYGFLGKMALDPILIAYVTKRAPKVRIARALALFNLSGMSSSIVAPPVTGFISDVTGSKAIGFYLSAALLIVGTVLFVLSTTRNNRKAAAVQTA